MCHRSACRLLLFLSVYTPPGNRFLENGSFEFTRKVHHRSIRINHAAPASTTQPSTILFRKTQRRFLRTLHVCPRRKPTPARGRSRSKKHHVTVCQLMCCPACDKTQKRIALQHARPHCNRHHDGHSRFSGFGLLCLRRDILW